MGNKGRILVRKSGTEPKIRVMAESYDKRLILKCIAIIKKINKKLKPKSKILIIAGSDFQVEQEFKLKTVTALGGYAMTAITAVTAQNTKGVQSVVPVKPTEIEKQIKAICEDIKPDGAKIGMLHSSAVINSVIKVLNEFYISKIVLDPVMIAKGGATLITKSAIKILKEKLIKKAYLITPNIPEAEILTKVKIINIKDMIFAANILLKLGG